MADLQRKALDNSDGIHLITLPLPLLPSLESILEDIHTRMAEVALAVWPNWYGLDVDFTKSDPILPANKISHAAVSRAWLAAASSSCRSGQLPLVRGIARNLQVEQLALAVKPGQLWLCLALPQKTSTADRLYGFARAVEWLAQHTHARIIVLLPETLSHEAALDSILYGARYAEKAQPKPNQKTEKPDEARHRLLPFVGQPHPFSPGEQILADHLHRDSELGPLFGFNVYVSTKSGVRYLVDLLWDAGKLVIEIDGYHYHSTPGAFAADRTRDYELIISGYLVLRLTHNEVVEDTALTLTKIRHLVHFRREQINGGLGRHEIRT